MSSGWRPLTAPNHTRESGVAATTTTRAVMAAAAMYVMRLSTLTAPGRLTRLITTSVYAIPGLCHSMRKPQTTGQTARDSSARGRRASATDTNVCTSMVRTVMRTSGQTKLAKRRKVMAEPTGCLLRGPARIGTTRSCV